MTFFRSIEAAANLVNSITREVDRESRRKTSFPSSSVFNDIFGESPRVNVIEVDLRPKTVVRETVYVREATSSNEIAYLYDHVEGLERHIELRRDEYLGNVKVSRRQLGNKKEEVIIKSMDRYGRENERTTININDSSSFTKTIEVTTRDVYGRRIGRVTNIEVNKGYFDNGKISITRY